MIEGYPIIHILHQSPSINATVMPNAMNSLPNDEVMMFSIPNDLCSVTEHQNTSLQRLSDAVGGMINSQKVKGADRVPQYHQHVCPLKCTLLFQCKIKRNCWNFHSSIGGRCMWKTIKLLTSVVGMQQHVNFWKHSSTVCSSFAGWISCRFPSSWFLKQISFLNSKFYRLNSYECSFGLCFSCKVVAWGCFVLRTSIFASSGLGTMN